MASVHIRPALVSDLPAVHALVRELAVYEKAEAEFTASIETYRKDFQAGVFDVLVAEAGEEVVGMCLFYLTFSTWKGKMLYLEDFVVREPFRRKGVGQQLFTALLEKARAMECRLVKWQVLDWNEPAIRFYEKQRALIEKEWWNGKIFLGPQ